MRKQIKKKKKKKNLIFKFSVAKNFVFGEVKIVKKEMDNQNVVTVLFPLRFGSSVHLFFIYIFEI